MVDCSPQGDSECPSETGSGARLFIGIAALLVCFVALML